jgi:hypothetical protein
MRRALFLLLVGCRPPAPAAPSALPGAPVEIARHSAKDLAQNFEESARVSGVIFGELRPEVTRSIPVVILPDGSALAFSQHEQEGWVYAGQTGERIVGVLDTIIESSGWTLEIVVSPDGGKSWWQTGTLDKPYYLATFHSLRVSPGGEGDLCLRLEDDYGSGIPTGVYCYHTPDWGKSWEEPKLAPLPPERPAQ